MPELENAGYFLLGIGVFLATNRAFAMLDLSNPFAAATSDAKRLPWQPPVRPCYAVGESHSPGTFLAFFLVEITGILISIVMLLSQISPTTAAQTDPS